MNGSVEQLPLAFSHPTKFYSDDLVVTKSNMAAYELIEHWPNWPMPVAVLVGPRGAGKTHFASVWADVANAKLISAQEPEEAIKQISLAKSVVIEDIDSQKIDEVAFFHLFNSVKQANLVDTNTTLLLTTMITPSNWDISLKDLISRLKSVTLATIEQPDDELLTSVAFKLFADRQIKVDTSVISYLISRTERSLQSLGKFVDAIDRLALQRKSKVTRSLVSDVLQDFVE